MRWWDFLNVDTIAAVCVIIAVIYCLFVTKRKPGKYKFLGLGDSGWDISEGNNFWDYGVPKNLRRKDRRSRRPRRQKFNKHEERCREIFQNIYGMKFKSVRPEWLKNPVTGKNLELDGFCEDIPTPIGRGLAFEYDGEQHSKYNKHFHRHGPDEFLYQVKKDSWKDIRCKQQKVFLVRIPHFVAYEDLERYITNKLRKKNLLPQRRFSREYTDSASHSRSRTFRSYSKPQNMYS